MRHIGFPLYIEVHNYNLVWSPSHVQLFAPHELQHARLPCPSLSSRVSSNYSLNIIKTFLYFLNLYKITKS